MIRTFLSIAAPILPIFVIGVLGFNRYSRFYKFHFFQATVALINYAIISMPSVAGQPNHHFFNTYLFIEFMLIFGAGHMLLDKSVEKKIAFVGYTVFLCSYIYEIYTNGFYSIAVKSLGIATIPIALLYIVLMFKVNSDDSKVQKSELWLILGVLIFFAASAPFFLILPSLTDKFPELSEILYTYLLEPLGHIRYLLAVVSFWLVLRNSKSTANG